MIELRQTETFRKWWTKLRDLRARALVAAHRDRSEATIVILLCGGDQGSQAEDIKTAKRMAADWSNGS